MSVINCPDQSGLVHVGVAYEHRNNMGVVVV
jgi:hypothetical protein